MYGGREWNETFRIMSGFSGSWMAAVTLVCSIAVLKPLRFDTASAKLHRLSLSPAGFTASGAHDDSWLGNELRMDSCAPGALAGASSGCTAGGDGGGVPGSSASSASRLARILTFSSSHTDSCSGAAATGSEAAATGSEAAATGSEAAAGGSEAAAGGSEAAAGGSEVA
eukprot:3319484-Prymnesium_polylepis.1